MVLPYWCRHPRAKVPADFGRAAILSGNTVPIGLRSIVVIDFAVIFARPIPPLALSVLWRSIELISREIHTIAAQTRVVVQRRPWHGVKIFTHTQEPAKAQNSVGYFAAHLVDHHALDRADFFAVQTVHCSPFHLIAANQRRCFSLVNRACRCRHFILPLLSFGNSTTVL